jgi:D-glycero-alpha-D-manno-heptose-7-phosphate kinase
MVIRSKAPFRIGLAGGGTDVSPYSDQYHGAILNATVSLFAYTTIIPRKDKKIIIKSVDTGDVLEFEETMELPIDGTLDLQKGIYNRIVKEFTKESLGFEIETSMDVPTGSGLGTSSTLVVSILGAFAEWLNLPLGEYDMAKLAYSIEREDLKMAGGKQDQYAATFGGFNFMEFYEDNRVIVNPLRIRQDIQLEMAYSLILYYTKTSRKSAHIIEKQTSNVKASASKPIEAMHKVKEQAFHMKDSLLTGELKQIGNILHESWVNKKAMAEGISNELIDDIYTNAQANGAIGGKISGAGGGGFMIFYAKSGSRNQLTAYLNTLEGRVVPYEFTNKGVISWSVED